MKRFAQRLALLVGTLFVLLVLLEIGLRVAASLVERERGGARGETTILCLGDSHTFGLHVPPALSYPALLQRELDPSARAIGVVNYGVPGRNSAALLRQLPEYLESVAPNLVLVLVGFNDSWNFDGANPGETTDDLQGDTADDSANADPSFLEGLRIARLFRLARLNLAGRDSPRAPRVFEADGRMMVEENGVIRPAAAGGKAFGVIEGAALRAQVSRNVEVIVQRIRARGARPLLLTYATENQPYFVDLNQNARDLATRLGCDLVELAIPFRESIAREGYATLFFGDDHPNARGNELFARHVANVLVERGLVTRVASEVRAPVTAHAALEVASIGDGLELRVSGPKDRDFQIAFSPKLEPPLVFHGVPLPLADDPMLERSLENLNLRGRTDGSGAASVRVDLEKLGAARETVIHGVVVFFDPAGKGGLGAISKALTVRVP